MWLHQSWPKGFPAICGSATLAIEVSITSMKVASITETAISHGLTWFKLLEWTPGQPEMIPGNDKLQHVKILFLFLCATGLAFSQVEVLPVQGNIYMLAGAGGTSRFRSATTVFW